MKVFAKHQHDIKLEDHIPVHSKNLISRVVNKKYKKYLLVGFSDTLKWLARIFSDQNINFDIFDWRPNFIGYDLNKLRVKSLTQIKARKNHCIVICNSQISEIKDSMKHLHDSKSLSKIDTFYYTEKPNIPYLDIPEFKEIYIKAKSLAPSMISDDQLFDLMQMVKNTNGTKGAIVEFGCYNGGSSAFLIKSRNYFYAKIYLLTFSESKSKYGLDMSWTSSFSNNSYQRLKIF